MLFMLLLTLHANIITLHAIVLYFPRSEEEGDPASSDRGA